MVSSKTLTWTIALFELVVSCAAMFGSLSIVCAQLQSTSIYEDKQSPSKVLIAICIGSLLLLASTIYSMMGLSKGKPLLMVPRILLLIIILCASTTYILIEVVRNLTDMSSSEKIVFVTTAAFLSLLQLGALYMEIRRISTEHLNSEPEKLACKKLMIGEAVASFLQDFIILPYFGLCILCEMHGGEYPGQWKKRQEEFSAPSVNLEPKYFPAKKAVSILAVIQLMLASSHFIENTVLLHRNFHDFYDDESRLVVAIIWALTFCWILSTFILLIGLFINLPLLLIPHIVFSIFWFLCKLIILLIMLISTARLPALLLTCAICITIAISLPNEWHCYQAMRVLL